MNLDKFITMKMINTLMNENQLLHISDFTIIKFINS
jgi:hypothetical protein